MALPSGYTQIEYIQSTGTQYIDTGLVPNQNTCIFCKARLSVGDTANWLFGTRASESSQQFYFGASADGYYVGGYGSSSIVFPENCNTEGAATLFTNLQTWFLDSDSTSETGAGTSSTFMGYSNLLLFACDVGGTIEYGKATIYSFNIISNGTNLREFVPCVNANGVAGLYDKVNNKFYTDAAGGSFVAGKADEFKTVNATSLDSAIKATADTIRLKKAGDTGDILWNESTGFADAIGSIITASAAKSASGTIEFGYSGPVTINGLGFRPTQIIVYLSSVANVTEEQMQNGYLWEKPLFAIYDDSTNTTASFITTIEYYEGTYDDGEVYEDSYINGAFYGNYAKITPTDDGFTVANISDGKYAYMVRG